MTWALDVDRPGPRTTVQDLGRPGHAHLGVPCSGAVDRPALRRANRLVGNADGAAGLEVTLGPLSVVACGDLAVAVAGAAAPVRVGDTAAGQQRTLLLRAGQRLTVGPTTSGVYIYVAVAGGIDVAPVLGSRSTDTLSGLGPPPLTRGTRLPVGPPPAAEAVCGADHPRQGAAAPEGQPLRLLTGPHTDRLARDAVATVLASAWTVTAASDRTALRLSGPAVGVLRPGIPSEALVPGAVQVPPDGQPILFLANHPTTGGYPVLGVVLDEDLPVAAQTRPGRSLRFTSAPAG